MLRTEAIHVSLRMHAPKKKYAETVPDRVIDGYEHVDGYRPTGFFFLLPHAHSNKNALQIEKHVLNIYYFTL